MLGAKATPPSFEIMGGACSSGGLPRVPTSVNDLTVEAAIAHKFPHVENGLSPEVRIACVDLAKPAVRTGWIRSERPPPFPRTPQEIASAVADGAALVVADGDVFNVARFVKVYVTVMFKFSGIASGRRRGRLYVAVV